MSLEVLQESIARTHLKKADPEVYRLFGLLSQLLKYAHDARNEAAVEVLACYFLRFEWDSSDELEKEMIVIQIESSYFLADILLERSSSSSPSPSSSAYHVDSRALGIQLPETTEEMLRIKRFVLSSLQLGMSLSLSLQDATLALNGLVFFFNLHIHIFRLQLANIAIEEYHNSLPFNLTVIEKVKTLSISTEQECDGCDILKAYLLEAYANSLESKGKLAAALEAVQKAVSDTSFFYYHRKRLVEVFTSLTLKSSLLPKAKPLLEPPKHDHVILTTVSFLTWIELLLSNNKEGVQTHLQKAIAQVPFL